MCESFRGRIPLLRAKLTKSNHHAKSQAHDDMMQEQEKQLPEPNSDSRSTESSDSDEKSHVSGKRARQQDENDAHVANVQKKGVAEMRMGIPRATPQVLNQINE